MNSFPKNWEPKESYKITLYAAVLLRKLLSLPESMPERERLTLWLRTHLADTNYTETPDESQITGDLIALAAWFRVHWLDQPQNEVPSFLPKGTLVEMYPPGSPVGSWDVTGCECQLPISPIPDFIKTIDPAEILQHFNQSKVPFLDLEPATLDIHNVCRRELQLRCGNRFPAILARAHLHTDESLALGTFLLANDHQFAIMEPNQDGFILVYTYHGNPIQDLKKTEPSPERFFAKQKINHA